MLSDGLSKRAAVLEMSFVLEKERELREKLHQKWQRDEDLQRLETATQITDQAVLNELIDCGVRADSLHVLMLVPLVHVAWANGFVERSERLAILQAAAQEGVKPEANGYELLSEWLKNRPSPTLLKTWKDYIAAIRRFVGAETFNTLQKSTISRARNVAEAAGGILGLSSVSRAEEAAIQELNAAFVQ